jgi:hypothetical protein
VFWQERPTPTSREVSGGGPPPHFNKTRDNLFADSKQGYRTEQDYTVRLSRYADAAEARLAYLEKRDPRFRWD